jgi:hypothetical protein
MPGTWMSSNPVTALPPPPIQEKHSPPIPLTPASPGTPSPAGPGIPATVSDHARDAIYGQHAPADSVLLAYAQLLK